MTSTFEINSSEFSRQVGEFADTLPAKHLAPFIHKISLMVLRGVVFKTPVETGRARGGWQVELNAEPTGQGSPDTFGGPAPAPEVDAGETVLRGLQVINTWRQFSDVVIANNVEYVIYLEDGTSQQAPAGMLSTTLAEVSNQFP